jgi:hypothetical protein
VNGQDAQGPGRDEPFDRHQVAAHHVRGARRTLADLLPLAGVLVVVAALVWWLLERGSAMGPWLVAAILFAHGWVHLVFLLPPTGRRAADQGAENPFDMDRSWLIERGADHRVIHRVGMAVALVTFVSFAAAALAVLGWLVPTDWWAGLLTTGAVGSTVLLVLSFAPDLILGFVINAGLMTLAIQTSWQVHR